MDGDNSGNHSLPQEYHAIPSSLLVCSPHMWPCAYPFCTPLEMAIGINQCATHTQSPLSQADMVRSFISSLWNFEDPTPSISSLFLARPVWTLHYWDFVCGQLGWMDRMDWLDIAVPFRFPPSGLPPTQIGEW